MIALLYFVSHHKIKRDLDTYIHICIYIHKEQLSRNKTK